MDVSASNSRASIRGGVGRTVLRRVVRWFVGRVGNSHDAAERAHVDRVDLRHHTFDNGYHGLFARRGCTGVSGNGDRDAPRRVASGVC